MVATVQLSRAALLNNLNIVRSNAPRAKVMAVVKANAYGHGVEPVLSVLAGHVDAFAVANLAEADELRALGAVEPVVLLQGVQTNAELKHALEHQYVPVIATPELVDLVASAPHQPSFMWLKYNTGMSRLGLEPNYLPPSALKNFGLMTHFACADEQQTKPEITEQQMDAYHHIYGVLLARLKGEALPRSLANSAAVLAWPRSHGDWVRPGIMLYGGQAVGDRTAEECGLLPVMHMQAPIVQINVREPGAAIGYGATYVCDRQRTIATISCGYGDGYPRHIADPANPPDVWLDGHRCPVVGRVSMDLMAIDVTSVDAPKVGDMVELWGGQISVDEVAHRCNSIGYELLTKVTSRVRQTVI